MFNEPRNRFHGIDSASLCSRAGRYVKLGCRTARQAWNRFLGSLKGLQIRAQQSNGHSSEYLSFLPLLVINVQIIINNHLQIRKLKNKLIVCFSLMFCTDNRWSYLGNQNQHICISLTMIPGHGPIKENLPRKS